VGQVWRIEVEKNLPWVRPGGGSSDASNHVSGVESMWNLQLSQEKLMELGLSLGAMCQYLCTAIFMGGSIGEKLER